MTYVVQISDGVSTFNWPADVDGYLHFLDGTDEVIIPNTPDEPAPTGLPTFFDENGDPFYLNWVEFNGFYETLSNLINDRFRTLVASPNTLTTQYENGAADRPENALFAKITIDYGPRNQITLGVPALFRVDGTMYVSIDIPPAQGLRAALVIVDLISSRGTFMAVSHIDSVSGTKITWRTPSLQNRGFSTELNRWALTLACPFQADLSS